MGSAAAEGAAASPEWSAGMQLMSAIAGCAAVGTVLWSEFVVKDTGEPEPVALHNPVVLMFPMVLKQHSAGLL
jgi:hypothetical protein